MILIIKTLILFQHLLGFRRIDSSELGSLISVELGSLISLDGKGLFELTNLSAK